jgi:glycosyltransferase involved in cell wall biosynthesis
VPPEDTDALATALIKLLSNEPLCRRWGEAGRRRAELEFTWDRVAERLEPIIQATAKVQAPS